MRINFPLQIGITASGEIQPVSQVPLVFWPKIIDIASDCHDQNVKLCRWKTKDTLILQTTRDIRIGQKLQMWFSEDLMMSELGIPPYLSPFNIKGGNSYVCHECQDKFERPNLLKLHLALHCDKLSLETIWSRLKSMGSSPLLSTPPYLVSLSPSSTVSLISSSTSSSPIFSISSTTVSAIATQQLPLQKQNLAEISQPLHNNLRPPTTLSSPSTPSPIIRIDSPIDAPIPMVTARPEPEANNGNLLVQQDPNHHHARLEAIVSNMGKAKNGHVCLYCGKLYSRKYGLKIHIRTHTGYKPLRCKICHRPFGDPSNLNKHVRLHSDGSTPYRCELCSKVLVRRRDLDRHIRARHGSSTQNGTRGANANSITLQQHINANHPPAVASSVVSSSRL
ncbi:unnamed protein product [Orchesella dallaii]|uniref:C2H2-type domain-containing protein n=1 Tax=Orchesella dallaii TaxID=48710 RepID=A0ABP1QT63_9HEXA